MDERGPGPRWSADSGSSIAAGDIWSDMRNHPFFLAGYKFDFAFSFCTLWSDYPSCFQLTFHIFAMRMIRGVAKIARRAVCTVVHGGNGCLFTPSFSSNLLRFNRGFAAQAFSFEDAKEKLATLSEDPVPSVKLQLYALFKQVTISGWTRFEFPALITCVSFLQATTGQCNAPKPGMMDMVGKAKWTAWNSLGNMSKVWRHEEKLN